MGRTFSRTVLPRLVPPLGFRIRIMRRMTGILTAESAEVRGEGAGEGRRAQETVDTRQPIYCLSPLPLRFSVFSAVIPFQAGNPGDHKPFDTAFSVCVESRL